MVFSYLTIYPHPFYNRVMKKFFQKFRVKPPRSPINNISDASDFINNALTNRDNQIANVKAHMEPMDWFELVAYRDELKDAIDASGYHHINRIYRFNLSVVEQEMANRIESC